MLDPFLWIFSYYFRSKPFSINEAQAFLLKTWASSIYQKKVIIWSLFFYEWLVDRILAKWYKFHLVIFKLKVLVNWPEVKPTSYLWILCPVIIKLLWRSFFGFPLNTTVNCPSFGVGINKNSFNASILLEAFVNKITV